MAEKQITEASVLALIKEGKITASRGAEFLGVPLQDFLDLMHAHGLTLCDETPEEIKQDLKILRKVLVKSSPFLERKLCRLWPNNTGLTPELSAF